MSLKAKIFLYILIVTVALSVVQIFFISKLHFDFQQKLGKHKDVATGLLVANINKTFESLKVEASLLSCPHNIGALLQKNDNTALMKWEKRMLKQGREVVFVYANGTVVSINTKFLNAKILRSTYFLKQILQHNKHIGMLAIDNVAYIACGEPIKDANGDELGLVVVLQPVTPKFLSSVTDDMQIVRLQMGDVVIENRPHTPNSSPFERVPVHIDGISADDGFFLAFLPNELLHSIKELQQKFLVGVPMLAIFFSLVLLCVIHMLLKPYSRILGYMHKYSCYDITLKEMRDGIYAMQSDKKPDLMKFKIVLVRMIDAIMDHIESIGSHTLRLEEMTKRDALTGLLNRSGIDAELLGSFEKCQKNKLPLSVLLIDIDRFKKINDTFGHLVGDKVLCRVANALSDHMRKCDAVGRWGGEEFLVVCPGFEASLAQTLAESLRKAVHSIEPTTGTHVTISVGVAQLLPGEKLNSLLGRADAALYKAKSSGRDCVIEV